MPLLTTFGKSSILRVRQDSRYLFETSLKFLRHCQVTQKYLNQNGEKIVKVPSPLTVSKICFAENDCSLKSNLNLNLTLSKDEQQLLSGLISLQ